VPALGIARPVGHRLAGGPGNERGNDVGGVPVQSLAAAVVAHGGTRVGVRGGLLDVAQRHAGVRAAVMNEWRRLCGEIRFVNPARRASRLTVRSAAWGVSR
jgi:hypothetical protein